jgi:hypothetical protein
MIRTFPYWVLVLLVSGCGIPSFLVTPVENPSELQQVQVAPGQGFFPAKVAIIPVEGTLIDERAVGLFSSADNPLSLLRRN